ncbi:uncharacterized protein KIAA2012-like [Coccinella septempunctata]|uniref:uncharacterized protein KIAA2012-like n=1 Tax=Coccinella septempunctata TaxID=41139 RepID=UPI001D08C675|nr:uncharacterized protein KIAA2012-like [Coccinella septempunctata]
MKKTDHKRNRSEEEEEDILVENKKVLRSPTVKNRGKEMDIENLERMFQRMMEEMKLEIRRNTEEVKLEMKNLKEEMKKREMKWEDERKELEGRIKVLEEKADREEKMKRKNNIVVKNLKVYDGKEKEEVKKLVDEELNLKVDITKAYKINRGTKVEMIVAEIASWDQKQNIMKAKQRLKGKDIYIDNDLTLKERQVQKQILEISRVEKSKEKKVRVGYRKIFIDGKLFVWDDDEQGVKEKEYANINKEAHSSKN